MQQLTRFILVPAIVGAIVGLIVIAFSSTQSDLHPAGKPGYAHAVAQAAPAVVNIYTTKITRSGLICRNPKYQSLCDAYSSEPQIQNSLGSGVIVREDGLVLTNQHVVAQADEILVMFANNQTTTATVIGTDSHTDLAVIKVAARGLPIIPQLDDESTQVGDIALAIGNPFGLGHSVSQGIISAFSRTIITNSPYDDFIQTDTAISPGNSGGALVDYRGRLLGINTMIYTQSGGSDGIGFAIPADIALYVLEQIVTHGRVIRGWLGISLTPQPLPSSPGGLHVTNVAEKGPAATAGIRVGDTVLSVNSTAATSAYVITQIIGRSKPGDTIEIEVMRDEQRFLARAIAAELLNTP